jgi:hypothetical protein
MIGKVLAALVICALVVFGVVWVMSGGLSRGIEYAKTISNPIAFIMGDPNGEPFKLPGQPDLMTGPDMGLSAGSTYENAIYDTNYSGISDASTSPADDPQTFGNPSPSHDAARLVMGNAVGQDARTQYIMVEAAPSNAAALMLSGWTIQSALSGVRAPLPQAAPVFVQGTVNAVGAVSLAPGEAAVVSTGFSPVGVSFKENRCSGYLAQFQAFTPALQSQCDAASDALASSGYPDDGSCYAFAQSLQPCTFPQSVPSGVSSSCHQALASTLTYNSCLARHRGDAGFSSGNWRLFLDASRPLWRTHDTLRLLDSQGRVVDTLTY